MAEPTTIFDAISNAETGGEKNPWIRTKVMPKGGSSAFGPAQITHDTILDAVNRKLLSPGSVEFATKVMLPMQAKMLDYGGKDMQPGFEAFDYGQTGGFDPNLYGEAYKQLTNELIQMKVNDKLGGKFNAEGFLKAWRGKTPDKGYKDRFFKIYKPVGHYKKD